MKEVMLKTHLIVKDVHDEYYMNWCGTIANVQPAFTEDGQLMFAVVSSNSRVEINTLDMSELERMAKKITSPKGRTAISKDIARIYVIDQKQEQHLLGELIHKRIKSFAPMYDKIGFR